MTTTRGYKFHFILCLVLVMLTSGLWNVGWIQRVNADAWTEISDSAGLGLIRDNPAGHYRLTADIDLNGISFTPIGSTAAPFTGVLDGNSKVISNFLINNTTDLNQGLLGVIGEQGEVRNLGIEDATVTAGDCSGILAGTNHGKVSGCYSKGYIVGKNYIGGLIGSNAASGLIENSYASAFVNGDDYTGGLVGANSGTVSSCYSSSEVAPALFNNYLQFDGVNDYIEIEHKQFYETSAFTLEAWFQWDPTNLDGDDNDVQFICGKGFENFEIHMEGGSGSNGMRFIPILGVKTAGDERGDSWLDAGESVQSGWFHVAAVYDYANDSASMYINGIAQELEHKYGKGNVVSLPRNENPLIGNNVAFNIGRRFDGTSGSLYFKGKISDVRFWNKARTAEEIAADKDRLLKGDESGLIGYWRLTEKTGETAYDLSVNHNNGQLNGNIMRLQEGSASHKGGLIGDNTGTVIACYYDSELTTQADTGKGEPQTTLQMKAGATFSSWDFSHVWGIDAGINAGYPYLIPVKPVAGSGKALIFDGMDDSILMPLPGVANALPLTVEAWVRPELTDEQTVNSIISSDILSQYGHGFNVNVYTDGSGNPASKLIVEYHDGFRTVTDYPFQAGSWYHVAIAYTNGNYKAYVNGTLVDDFSFDQGELDGEDFLRIGKHNDDGANAFFRGAIDEIRVWRTVRTQQEIAENVYKPLTGVEDGLAGYWRFDEGSGMTVLDAGPLHADGLVNGMASSSWIDSDAWSSRFTNEDTPLIIDAGYDYASSNLSITPVVGPVMGFLTADNSSMQITYVPDADVSGDDSFFYRLTDEFGNSSSIYNVNITIKPVNDGPTGAISINGGAEETDNRAVHIDLSASDIDGTVADMSFSDDNEAWSDWKPYEGNTSYQLPSGNGAKTVFVKFRDNNGAESAVYSDSIALILPNMETSAGEVSYLGSSPVLVDPNLIIRGTTLDGCRVMIENLFPGDVLAYSGALPAGVTASWNGVTGLLTFSGPGTVAEYQALLRTVKFSTFSTVTTPRNITFSLGTAIPSNEGHYYEYISNTVSWTEAFVNASNRGYFGMKGYLATISSFDENELIRQRLQADAWIGASDDYYFINQAAGTSYINQLQSEGEWYWVTGPEAGQLFSVNNTNPALQPGMYMNWNAGEPNNAGNEHYGEIYSSDSAGQWNDLPNTSGLGYVVEYGGMAGDPVLQLSSGKTINIETYQITYDGNGNTRGTPPTDMTNYNYHGMVPVQANTGGLERDGYNMVGWNTQPDGNGTNYRADGTDTLTIESDITIFANWTINQYQLNYQANENGSITGAGSQTVDHGGNGAEVVAVPVDGYHFVSWDDGLLTANRTDINVSGDINVTASFAINQYTVTFDSQGGSVIPDASAEHGALIDKPLDPSRDGYTFDSWYKDITFEQEWLFNADLATENITLYAKWINLAPSVSISINNGDAFTNSLQVEIAISAFDPENDPLTHMSFSDDSVHWSAWEDFGTTKSYILLPGDGQKTVYIKVRDSYGNESDSFSESITLKTDLPVINGVVDGGIYNTHVVPSFTEETALLSKEGGSSNPFTSETEITDEGNYTLVLTDVAGNSATISFTIDKTAPSGSMSINSGEAITTLDSLTMDITASDSDGSGVSEMRFSADGITWSLWEPYSIGKEWTAGAYGIVTVHMQLKDHAGNISEAMSDSIEYKSIPGSVNIRKDGVEDTRVVLAKEDFAFSNEDGGLLTKVMIVTLPHDGVLELNGSIVTENQEIEASDLDQLTFSPDSDWFGLTSFRWKGSDAIYYSENEATLSIDLAPVNDAPVANNGSLSIQMDEAAAAILSANDIDSDTLVYSVVTQGSKGIVTITDAASGAYVYTPDDGVSGSDSFTFVVSDGEANSNTATIAVNIIPLSVPDEVPEAEPSNKDNIGTSSASVKYGETTITLTVDKNKLEQKLNESGTQSTITLPFDHTADSYVGELNGQMVKSMEDKQAVIEVKTFSSSYTIPANEINIQDVSDQLGKDVSLEDIKVQITIAEPADEKTKLIENMAREGEITIVVPAVEFHVSCSYQGKTVEVSSFNSYVERSIAIPDGVDPSRITTGVVLEPDGTLRHVPTKIMTIDGRYYATINSLTNSIYTVVWNPVEHLDVEDHWAKASINDMASRMILSGNEQGLFEPEKNMSRGEFVMVVVKALGLKPVDGAPLFNDVSNEDVYDDFIRTAYKYSMISGYGDGSFRPNAMITREQAITIIARAMRITGLIPDLTIEEVALILSTIKDDDAISHYARTPIAACLKTEVASGRGSRNIAPVDNITRAEIAVLVRKLLQKSGLI